MDLKTLTLNNFKGIKQFTLDANRGNVEIHGDNATGKTTVFDAVCWLLFGKDSLNRSDFEIKTLDADGKPIPRIDHFVEATFSLGGGSEVTLKRLFKEVYTRKRGSASEEMTGHTTDYFLDGVPVKEKEYKARIDSILPEDVFKLITNPLFFNEQLKPEDRRKLLFTVCGSMTDEEVMLSDDKLSKLEKILDGKSVDDYKKIITARKSAINKELDIIPARIDELSRIIDEIPHPISEVQKTIKYLEGKWEKAKEKVAELSNGDAANYARKTRISTIDYKIQLLEEFANSEYKKKLNEAEAHLKNAISKNERARDDKETLLSKIKSTFRRIDSEKFELAELKDKFNDINAQTYTDKDDIGICPCCGQLLPADQIESVREEAVKKFNADKSDRLRWYQTFIDTKEQLIEALQNDIVKHNAELSEVEKEIFVSDSEITLAEGARASIKKQDIHEISEMVDMLQEREMLVNSLSEGVNEAEIEEAKAEAERIYKDLQATHAMLAKIEANEENEARISELEDELSALSAEYQELESHTVLIEDFIKSKVRLLEESINSKFAIARFKLFDVQVNGGIRECCETTFNNVPYRSMNNAARINVGIDIINVLTEHFGETAPVFIDNAEAVTKLFDSNSQVIRLIVDESVKELKVIQ